MAELWFYVPNYTLVRQILEKAYERHGLVEHSAEPGRVHGAPDDADITVRAKRASAGDERTMNLAKVRIATFRNWLANSGINGLQIEGRPAKLVKLTKASAPRVRLLKALVHERKKTYGGRAYLHPAPPTQPLKINFATYMLRHVMEVGELKQAEFMQIYKQIGASGTSFADNFPHYVRLPHRLLRKTAIPQKRTPEGYGNPRQMITWAGPSREAWLRMMSAEELWAGFQELEYAMLMELPHQFMNEHFARWCVWVQEELNQREYNGQRSEEDAGAGDSTNRTTADRADAGAGRAVPDTTRTDEIGWGHSPKAGRFGP